MMPFRRLAITNVKRAGFGLLATAALLLLAAPASHATLGDVGFQVSLSAKEMVLEHPNDHAVEHFSAWDAPYQRIADRNMPFVELMNLGGSTGNLTEFRMTIGDTDYNYTDSYFGSYVMLGDSTPGFNLSSSVALGGDQLVVSIGNGGLAPGETLRFRIDLDVDAGILGYFPHPDFRTVLFDMNDQDGNGMSDNAIVSAFFVDPNDDSMTASAESELLDFDVDGPQANYFNQFIRPYSVMEGVDIFRLQALTPASTVPEPGTATLAVGGLLALGALVRQRRKR